ncbi:MAG: amidohydrolase [Ruminococcaceae bacterium]|nr:amidohydrolase [Oscillospiraceae bacterium]
MFIDFHTHAFPAAIATRVLASLSAQIHIDPLTDGTAESLINRLDEWKIDRAVVCNIATNPKQTTNVNNYAIETLKNYGERLIPLGSINPEFENKSDEIERIHNAGISGIKIHPDYMHHTIDDPLFDEIFDTAAQLGMFIITHAGFDVYSPDKIWATPDAILNRIKRSPRSTLICAHLGGNMLWDEVEDKLAGQNVYFDTAFVSFDAISQKTAERIIKKHDSNKILFGSDCPWCSSRATADYIDSLDLTEELKEKIFFRNALELLKK